MTDIMAMLYPWLRAAHVIFVIFWMAGLFMLPRLFVYHHQCAVGSTEDSQWQHREARLVAIILNPSIIIVWILGLLLAWHIGALAFGWFHAKLLVVLALSGYHGWMVGYARKLARGERPMQEKTLRLVNEVPAIAAALIVILVIVKPF